MDKFDGFNASHTLAYSLIALQEMNLAYNFPLIFWNCACLISDSGGAERTDEDEQSDQDADGDFTWDETPGLSMEDFTDDDEESDDEDEDDDTSGTAARGKKKASKSANYGRIATAIGKMRMGGIDIAPPDINKSSYTFSPDPAEHIIRYGMSGIVKVGEDLVKSIIENRPYKSIDDFLARVKITKPQMVNLIKAGAFDAFGDRAEIMRQYIEKISDAKKRITLQNMKMLIDFGLIPDEFDMERRVYNFNKYIKKMKLGDYYGLDSIAFNFYEANFEVDRLVPTEETESGFKVNQTIWDNIYKKHMDIIRPWVQKHSAELLVNVNNRLTSDIWNKYCLGSLSKWEMDSVSFYSHEHELSNARLEWYGCEDFFDMPENPIVDRVINIKGKQVPLFSIKRIAGTVLDKNKDKKTVTLLTNSGVVTVKIYGAVFSHYDKQISQKGADGKKHVIEKSWLSRGNKIIVTGIRQEDAFVAKKYSRTPWHLVELITEVKEDGTIRTRGERAEVEE